MTDINVHTGQDARPTPTPWLLAAFLLWLSDIFWTKFIGIDYVLFGNQATLELFVRSMTNVIILLILLPYLLSQRGPDRRSMLNVLTFFALEVVLFIIIQVGQLSLGNLFHILIALGTYFMILKGMNKEEPYKANIALLLILVVDFFLLNMLYQNGVKVYIIPIWFFALWGVTSKAAEAGIMRHTGLASFIKFLVLALFIISYGTAVFGWQDMNDRLDPSVQGEVRQVFVDFWNNLLGIPKGAQEIWNDTTQVYHEDYYTAEIDSNAQKELGVFIEDMEKSQPDFYMDEPVSVWATLVVSTLKDQIHVSTGCVADKDDESQAMASDYLEPEEFDAEQYDQVPVDCTFESYRLTEGSHRISINTTFDFQTLAYQKKYFMNKQRYYAYRRQEIDPLEQYGIADKEPVAVYTSGPMMIGMDTRGSLITIDTDSDSERLMLGITLRNNWDGTIKQVIELTVTVPSSLQLDGDCSGMSFSGAGTNEDGNLYSMDEPIGEIEDYRTFRCPFVVSDPDLLLGEAPLSIRYFKARATYTYTIEESTTVNVRMSDDLKELKEKTVANVPELALDNMRVSREETREIDLHEHTTDVETDNPDLFSYKVSDIEDDEIVNCEIVRRHFLSCTSKTRSGVSAVSVEVNDLAKTGKATFKVCVDTECTEDNEDKGDPEETDGEGPRLSKEFPTLTIDRSASSTAQIYVPEYIQDGDQQTAVSDLDFPEPGDEVISRSITRSPPQIWFLFEATGDGCFESHPYTFTATDSDGNSNQFTIPFTITGCS